MLTKTVAVSDNLMISAIANTQAWAGEEISYGFLPSDLDENGLNDFDEGNWRAFYKAIFDNVGSFADVKFVEKPAEQAMLRQFLNVGQGAFSGMPWGSSEWVGTTVDISLPVAAASEIVIQGRFSEYWYHEIGHSLGLMHTFEHTNRIDAGVSGPGDIGDNFLNSDLYSTMTYLFYVWGEDNPFTAQIDVGQTSLNAAVGSFMPIDIAALQHLYGRSANATGADRYVFTDDLVSNKGYTTIWDTGGNDTIAYEGEGRTKIDLRSATLRHEIGGGGFLSTSETLTGGFLIANGVTIENAVGASNADLLIGNDVANTLHGWAGNDVLRGMAGNDTLIGGDGSDILSGGAGHDTLRGDAGGDVFLYGFNDAGRDGIADFSMDDVLVTTNRIRDANGDGRIDFAGDGLLNIGKAKVAVTADDGTAVRALEYDGFFEQGGVTFYVYSRVGSSAGAFAASSHDYTLML